jgi:hypothetical protein
MVELTKILKDEAYLESEKRGTKVPLSDKCVYERSVKIWEKLYDEEKNSKLDMVEADGNSF